MPLRLEELTDAETDAENLDRLKKRAVSLSIRKIIVEEHLKLHKELSEAHEGQFIVISYESAEIYPNEEKADVNFRMLSPETQKRVMKFRMGGGALGGGYALVKNPEIKWFESVDEMSNYRDAFSAERLKTVVEGKFSSGD